eukprot:s5239_g6.t1
MLRLRWHGLRTDLGFANSEGCAPRITTCPDPKPSWEEFASFYSSYQLGTALGKGSYGCVFLAKALYSQASYAVKVQTSRRTAAQKIQHEAS